MNLFNQPFAVSTGEIYFKDGLWTSDTVQWGSEERTVHSSLFRSPLYLSMMLDSSLLLKQSSENWIKSLLFSSIDQNIGLKVWYSNHQLCNLSIEKLMAWIIKYFILYSSQSFNTEFELVCFSNLYLENESY